MGYDCLVPFTFLYLTLHGESGKSRIRRLLVQCSNKWSVTGPLFI